MHLLVTIRIACRALRKNKMRAGLTVLGVVIGIAAVTTMVSIGQSANSLLHNELESLGTNVLLVFPSGRRGGAVHRGSASGGVLTPDDAAAIVEECSSVLAVSPVVGAGGQVIYGNTNWSPDRLLGVGTDHLTVGNWTLRRGGFFSEQDIASAAKVCVIGHTLVAELFQTTNAIDETIRISNIPFRVVGVLEPKGAALDGRDQDNIVLAPYTTVRKRLSRSARDKVDVQNARYRNGVNLYLNVLQAITSWGNSVNSEARALVQYNIELANLQRRSGVILDAHGIRFAEERYCAIGPLGRMFPGRCYPRDIRPGPNADQYQQTDEPAENAFDLADPTPRQQSTRPTPD